MARSAFKRPGHRRRKKKKNKNPNRVGAAVPGEEGSRVPRSMVFSRGSIGRTLRRLEIDVRKMMMPHTAAKLKESKRNSIKDFLQVAGPLGVTNFVVLSASELAPYIRIARTPRGPTLTFKIREYSLAADVANAQAKPRVPPNIFETPPLLVMQGLSAGEGSKASHQQLKLVSIMFQNMFPAIDVSTVHLAECRRVLLLSHDAERGVLELRHYTIRAKPVGVTKSIRRLVQSHKVPDLGAFADISEFVMRGGYGSESEAEDEASHVRLPQDIGRGNRAAQQSAVQLHELGPRLTLELVKVEEGLLAGAVMYHQYVTKSADEVAEQRKQKEEKESLKRKRKQEQEENVRKKEQARQQHREASRRRGKTSAVGEGGEKEEEEEEEEEGVERLEARGQEGQQEEDDDAEWYRQEVGEEPDEGFSQRSRPRKGPSFDKRKQRRT